MNTVKRPLFIAASGVAAGIFISCFCPAAVLIAVFLAVILLLFKKIRVAVFVFAAALLAGFFYNTVYCYKEFSAAKKWAQSAEYFTARVISLPRAYDDVNSVKVKSENIKINLFYNDAELSFGDIITVKTESISDSTESLRAYGIFISASADSISVSDNRINNFSIRDLSLNLRSYLVREAKKLWEGETLMFAQGMLFGENLYSDSFYETLSQGSISHIIAVSGLHVSFVGAIVLLLIRSITKKRYFSLLSLPVVWFFVFLTGASPSAQRAAVMFSLYIISEELFAPCDPLSSVGAAAIFILAQNPMTLFSLSFIMSFAAVLGIIIFAPAFKRLLSFLPKKAAELLSVSLGAQVFIFPVTALEFSNISFLSVLANLFVVPLVPVMIVSGYAAVIFEAAGLELSHLFSEVFRFLSGFALKTASVFGSIPFANIHIGVFNTALFLIFFTVFLVFLYFALIKKHSDAAYISANAALIFLSALIIFSNTSPEEGIYLTGGAAIVSDGESAVMIADEGDRLYRGGELYSYLEENKIFNLDAVLFINDMPPDGEIKDFLKDFNVQFSGSLSESAGLKAGEIFINTLYGTDGSERIYEITEKGKAFIAAGGGEHTKKLCESLSGGVYFVTESEFLKYGLNPDMIFFEKTKSESRVYKIIEGGGVISPEEL